LFILVANKFHIAKLVLGTNRLFAGSAAAVMYDAMGCRRWGLIIRLQELGDNKMKKTALLTAILVMTAYPLMAKPYQGHQHAQLGYQRSHHAYAYQNVHRTYQTRHVFGGAQHGHALSNNLGDHSHITCDMVRSYVAQVGLEQAKAMAIAAGMTASEERRARQCLANRV
jgi:hypothetical protein